MVDIFSRRLRDDDDIVQVVKGGLSRDGGLSDVHCSLKRASVDSQCKRHPCKSIRTMVGKRRLDSVSFYHLDLPIAAFASRVQNTVAVAKDAICASMRGDGYKTCTVPAFKF